VSVIEATTKLAEIGHRITGPRRAVLDAIGRIEGPFTIEELSAAAPAVGRATVFRTVKLLQESDVICRMVLEDGGVRYELSSGGHHHHLICGACGRVDEFGDPALDALIRDNARTRAFHLDGHSLELYGRCSACR
jgi:Fur family transcriptional regulator, ferric uptake regulator